MTERPTDLETIDTFEYVNHPKSGDCYACGLNIAGAIVRAIGPVSHRESGNLSPSEHFYAVGYREETARADGAWLEAAYAAEAVH